MQFQFTAEVEAKQVSADDADFDIRHHDMNDQRPRSRPKKIQTFQKQSGSVKISTSRLSVADRKKRFEHLEFHPGLAFVATI